MKRRIQIFLLGMTIFLAWNLRAADSPFIVDTWSSAEDGLPQSSIFSLVQTHEGYLWFGTLNGLVRFDGNAFTLFNVNNTPGLPSDVIVFLFEDRQNILWVGSDNGKLCAIQNGALKTFVFGGAGAKIIYAYEDERNGVWFCAADGRVFYWQNGRLDLNPPVSGDLWKQLFQRAFHSVVPRSSGGFWHLEKGNNHLEKWSDHRLEKDLGMCPWSSSFIPAMLSDNRTNVLVYDAYVTAACADNAGGLIIGTRNSGVYWFDAAGNYQHIPTGDRNVLSLCFDREGNLWIGTDGKGLWRVKKNHFSAPEKFSGRVAKSVAEDANGGIWAAFGNGGGLTYSLADAVHNFRIGNYGNAWSVLVDRRQRVWAGTYNEGLFRLEAGKFLPVIEAGKIGPQINALFQSADGKLWVGGQNGLGSFDGKSWNFFSAKDDFSSSAVRALAKSANGNLWIGTDNGLFELRAGKISPVNAPVRDISCLLVDVAGALWAGTAGHGLARFQNGRWMICSAANTGVSDIGYLIQDGQKNLWLGSYEGLMRLTLGTNAAGAEEIVASREFGKSDGLPAQECSTGAQPAAMRARDGALWFPTINGLVSLNPADLKLNTNPPPVIIESIAVDGVPQKTNPLSSAWPESITLTPQNERLEIHFTALNFSAPKRAQLAVRFKYQLIGRDKNFTDIGGERVAHFNKLPPGNYDFHVIACNADGVWNQTGAHLKIIVQPPFWRTKSFLILSALILLGALAGTIYLISTAKLKRELRALHQKELIERERARIARDLHDQLGANLTQVALLGEMAEVDKNLPDEIEQHAQQICETARDTTRSLDEIVWAVNPSNDTLEGLVNYAGKYAQDYFALANVSYRAELPPDLPAAPILPEVRHNVFLAFKEAVNNVVKHARATEARVKLQLKNGRFVLSVADNGRGLGDLSEKKLRNGLKNMRKRLADVGGEFEISSAANGGTIVQLIVPLKTK